MGNNVEINLHEEIKREGYLYLPEFYPKDQVDEIETSLRSKTASTISFFTQKNKNNFIKDMGLETSFAFEKQSIKYLDNAEFFVPSISKLITNKLLHTATKVTNCEVYLDRIEVHQKLPGVSITPPHQDNFYFGFDLSKMFGVTAYLALNNQTAEAGLIEFYPKSHKQNFKHHPSKTVGFSSGISANDLEGLQKTSIPMKPGDIIIHHCNIVHEAGINQTNKRRPNLAFRFFPCNPIYDPIIVKRYQAFSKRSVRLDAS